MKIFLITLFAILFLNQNIFAIDNTQYLVFNFSNDYPAYRLHVTSKIKKMLLSGKDDLYCFYQKNDHKVVVQIQRLKETVGGLTYSDYFKVRTMTLSKNQRDWNSSIAVFMNLVNIHVNSIQHSVDDHGESNNSCEDCEADYNNVKFTSIINGYLYDKFHKFDDIGFVEDIEREVRVFHKKKTSRPPFKDNSVRCTVGSIEIDYGLIGGTLL